ncbi:MAG TPA: barstar family protein [Allosphingosinicella sp.]|nr:barstar family protein [Allosphingosinicella sp.]
MELILDGKEIGSEAAFHDVIDKAARSVGFKGYGRNLDALEEVLAAILPAPVSIRWVNADRSRTAIGARFDKLIDVMTDAETELGTDQFRFSLER